MRTGSWIAGAALVLLAGPVSAQGGESWTAWRGCWAPVGAGATDVAGAITGAGASGGELLCVVPGEDARSVRMITVRDRAIVDETVVHADGVARPVSEGGCSGTESAVFSQDGRRIYTRSELECDGVTRTSTGVLSLLVEDEWVDVQSVEVSGQTAVRTLRYRAASAPASLALDVPAGERMSVETARMRASAPFTPEMVVEASSRVDAAAVEALLAARQQGFDLSPRTLLALKDAGLAESTIDVMVALSYPQKFAVRDRSAERNAEADAAWLASRGTSRDRYSSCFDTWGYATSYDPYCASSYRSRLGYSPWGYNDGYGWNRYDRGTPVVIIVEPRDPGEAEDGSGKVVKGRGYTAPDNARGAATPRSRPAATSGSGSTGSVRAAPAPRPSSTSTPPASSSGTTRTAKPKPDTAP